jgi:cytochrome c55X
VPSRRCDSAIVPSTRVSAKRQATTLPGILGRYGIAQTPAAPATGSPSPELRAARSTYLTQCSQCHGVDARGTPAAADLRAFKGSEADFVRVVRDGRPGTAMTPWKGLISDDDIRAIARYLKEPSTDATR